MFATLDPTIRSVSLPSRRKVLLSDTVGFIRNLPHTLVSAFRATLEEVQRASLVLQVSDASSPLSAEQDAQVDKVLKELEADGKPRLRVMNKIDLLPPKQRESLLDDASRVHVSAAKGIGMTTLLDRIDEMLSEDPIEPGASARSAERREAAGAARGAFADLFARSTRTGMVELEVEAPESVVRKVREWVVRALSFSLWPSYQSVVKVLLFAHDWRPGEADRAKSRRALKARNLNGPATKKR